MPVIEDVREILTRNPDLMRRWLGLDRVNKRFVTEKRSAK